jgi:electron transfer flavoprotein alpha subunit
MGVIWVVGEVDAAGVLTKLSGEAATAARAVGEAGSLDVRGVIVAAEPDGAAASLATFLPVVLAVRSPEALEQTAAAVIAARVAALAVAAASEPPSYVVVGATPDGRDLAGALSALLEVGVLVGATGLAWGDATDDVPAGPRVEMQPFGGRIVTTSAFTGERGIILLRSNMVAAEPLAAPGRVEAGAGVEGLDVALVRVVERVVAQSTGPSIEEARVIVSGGRGVGGPEGFAGLGELAGLLGGAVGATRAAVDAGWVDYAIQIGQTGKTVKPAVYLAFGVSGAIQHKVGMQTAETIVAVNRDPDAPIGEFADLFVVADLATVVPALAAALRARAG